MQTRAGAPTDTGPAFIVGLPIDKRVRRLVHTLNQIPGVSTYSSCGGHRNPSLTQEAVGTFYVELIATSGLVGYRAIQGIIRAIDVFYPYMTLTPWLNGDLISWSLRGTRVSPDRVARALSELAHAPRQASNVAHRDLDQAERPLSSVGSKNGTTPALMMTITPPPARSPRPVDSSPP